MPQLNAAISPGLWRARDAGTRSYRDTWIKESIKW